MKTLPIQNAGFPLPLKKSDTSEVSQAKQSFSDVMKSMVNEVNQADFKGNEAIQNFVTGKAENLHDVMIAMEEADMAIKMLVQMRNKASEAYNEIMRLQI